MPLIILMVLFLSVPAHTSKPTSGWSTLYLRANAFKRCFYLLLKIMLFMGALVASLIILTNAFASNSVLSPTSQDDYAISRANAFHHRTASSSKIETSDSHNAITNEQARASRNLTPPALIPTFVDFSKQYLCRPAETTVTIVNMDSASPLILQSLSSRSNDFHATWFQDDIIQPGQNTSFSIIFLARLLGRQESTILIATSQGNVKFEVSGISLPNPNGLRPFVSGRVSHGLRLAQAIMFYNPASEPLKVEEIFSSTEDIQLDMNALFVENSEDNPDVQISDHVWEIQPYRMRPLIVAVVTSATNPYVSGYINIRTNVTQHDAIIPVEVDIVDEDGLYFGPGDSLDFSILHRSDPRRHRPLQLIFHDSDPKSHATIHDIRVLRCHKTTDSFKNCPHVTIHHRPENFHLKPFTWTRVATITLATARLVVDPGVYEGVLEVYYSTSRLRDTCVLHVPLTVTYAEGSLDLPGLNSSFYVGWPPFDPITRTFTVANTFSFPVQLSHARLPSSIADILQVKNFEPTLLYPSQKTTVDVVFHANSSDFTFQSALVVTSNASETPLSIPVFSYNGFLKYAIGDEGHDSADFGSVSVNTPVSMLLRILNNNPVSVNLVSYSSTISNTILEPIEISPSPDHLDVIEYGKIFSGEWPIPKPLASFDDKELQRQARNLSVELEPGHIAIFNLSISPSSGKHIGDLQILSTYEVMHIPIAYEGSRITLNLHPQQVHFNASFPWQLLLQNDYGIEFSETMRYLTIPQRIPLYIRPPFRNISIHRISTTDSRVVLQQNPTVIHGVRTGSTSQIFLGHIVFNASRISDADNYIPKVRRQFNSLRHPAVLTRGDVDEVLRCNKIWNSVVRRGKSNVHAYLMLEANDESPHVIDVHASLMKPSILSEPSLSFNLTHTKTTATLSYTLSNPSDLPLIVTVVPIEDVPDGPIISAIEQAIGIVHSDLVTSRQNNRAFFVTPNVADQGDLYHLSEDIVKQDIFSGLSSASELLGPLSENRPNTQHYDKNTVKVTASSNQEFKKQEENTAESMESCTESCTDSPTNYHPHVRILEFGTSGHHNMHSTMTGSSSVSSENTENTANDAPFAKATAFFDRFIGTVRGTSSTPQLQKKWGILIPPRSNTSINVNFSPEDAGYITSHLLFVNNLTIFEVLRVTGEAGRGSFGFPKTQPHIIDDSLTMQLSSDQLKHCHQTGGFSLEDSERQYIFNFTVVNRGNLPVLVHDISVGGDGCSSSGFSVLTCEPFELKPRQHKKMVIAFNPDFTTVTTRQALHVKLNNITQLSFPMIATVPANMLSTCFSAMPGPHWAQHFKHLVVILLLSIAGGLIYIEYASGTLRFVSCKKMLASISIRLSVRNKQPSDVVSTSTISLSSSNGRRNKQGKKGQSENVHLVAYNAVKSGGKKMLKKEGSLEQRPLNTTDDIKDATSIVVASDITNSVNTNSNKSCPAEESTCGHKHTHSHNDNSAKLNHAPTSDDSLFDDDLLPPVEVEIRNQQREIQLQQERELERERERERKQERERDLKQKQKQKQKQKNVSQRQSTHLERHEAKVETKFSDKIQHAQENYRDNSKQKSHESEQASSKNRKSQHKRRNKAFGCEPTNPRSNSQDQQNSRVEKQRESQNVQASPIHATTHSTHGDDETGSSTPSTDASSLEDAFADMNTTSFDDNPVSNDIPKSEKSPKKQRVLEQSDLSTQTTSSSTASSCNQGHQQVEQHQLVKPVERVSMGGNKYSNRVAMGPPCSTGNSKQQKEINESKNFIATSKRKKHDNDANSHGNISPTDDTSTLFKQSRSSKRSSRAGNRRDPKVRGRQAAAATLKEPGALPSVPNHEELIEMARQQFYQRCAGSQDGSQDDNKDTAETDQPIHEQQSLELDLPSSSSPTPFYSLEWPSLLPDLPAREHYHISGSTPFIAQGHPDSNNAGTSSIASDVNQVSSSDTYLLHDHVSSLTDVTEVYRIGFGDTNLYVPEEGVATCWAFDNLGQHSRMVRTVSDESSQLSPLTSWSIPPADHSTNNNNHSFNKAQFAFAKEHSQAATVASSQGTGLGVGFETRTQPQNESFSHTQFHQKQHMHHFPTGYDLDACDGFQGLMTNQGFPTHSYPEHTSVQVGHQDTKEIEWQTPSMFAPGISSSASVPATSSTMASSDIHGNGPISLQTSSIHNSMLDIPVQGGNSVATSFTATSEYYPFQPFPSHEHSQQNPFRTSQDSHSYTYSQHNHLHVDPPQHQSLNFQRTSQDAVTDSSTRLHPYKNQDRGFTTPFDQLEHDPLLFGICNGNEQPSHLPSIDPVCSMGKYHPEESQRFTTQSTISSYHHQQQQPCSSVPPASTPININEHVLATGGTDTLLEPLPGIYSFDLTRPERSQASFYSSLGVPSNITAPQLPQTSSSPQELPTLFTEDAIWSNKGWIEGGEQEQDSESWARAKTHFQRDQRD